MVAFHSEHEAPFKQGARKLRMDALTQSLDSRGFIYPWEHGKKVVCDPFEP